MDLKKSSVSVQFPYCGASPRRKVVVSGFGLGVLASIIVLSVVLFNVSFKSPFLSPVFQGFNRFHVSNNNHTSVVPWPFSLSSSRNSFSSSSSSSNTTSVDLRHNVGEGNVSVISQKGSDLGSIGEGISLGETHVGNFSEKVRNGSLALVEGGRVKGKPHFINGSDIGENVNLTNSKGEGVVLGRTHMGNFSEEVKNGSFSGGDVVAGKSAVKLSSLNNSAGFTDSSNNGKNKVTRMDHAGNLSHNRDNVGCIDKESRCSDIKNQSSSEKNNSVNVSSNDSQPLERHKGSFENCDIFDGRWARDDSKPYYPAGSCPHIDRDFDCHLNGRRDDGFLKWRWQPYGCDIPSLNATDFLERLRGKKLVFVGDSLNRNMWESLVCILRHSVRNKKRVHEISGKKQFKKKGFYAFRYEDYNCSVDFVSTSFLVRESSFNGRNGSFETLRLDLMDRTTSMYGDADVVVFNTGHWWTHEKTSRGEDYYQDGNHVYPRLKVLEAYKKALATWARWVDKNIDGSRTQVIFRGYSVTHFRGGQWNSGGQCHKETDPIFNETFLSHYPSKMRVLEHVLREMKTPVIYLNISRLTDYRKDGHPSIYRKEYKTVEEQISAEQSQDCSHWCLPGVPDTWNELLYASLLQTGKDSWRR